jgi:hypothetical protein
MDQYKQKQNYWKLQRNMITKTKKIKLMKLGF